MSTARQGFSSRAMELERPAGLLHCSSWWIFRKSSANSSTDEGTVSSSSSDCSLPSPSFQVNSCSANAMARGNSSGKECSTNTAPGGGDTPKIKTTGY
ncbi:hypothetical protein EYF80_003168 [Liparis tanakae]|uniref:Uncharacterized protein n=1 Tax=Liparis tanakae TaxID=230148 RepID=A0A4Z2J9P0_9TELE|nr:hypothetical protein EYF80_003168 [Liparis tanakae]